MTLTQALRPIGILAAGVLMAGAVGLKPVAVLAMGTDNPPPTDDSKKKDKKGSALEQKNRDVAQAEFLLGYRAARQLILAGNYKDGIAALHALGHDEHPDVANYIGYSYRRLGDYADAKVWYEKALAADPKHVRTWQYYGLWHLEQGNRLKAEEYLKKIGELCGGTGCKEYVSLHDALDGNVIY